MTIYDPVTGEITNSELIDDELDFDVDSFNDRSLQNLLIELFGRNCKEYRPGISERTGKDFDLCGK